jgi:uncharacterized repeat protein (TIGR03803 family)
MLLISCHAGPVFPALPPQKAPVADISNHGENEMKSMRFSLPLLAALAITYSLTMRAQAQTFTTLASFGGQNGERPYHGYLIQSINGSYYGVAREGGKYGSGTFFEITPAGQLTKLYNFCSQTNCDDGSSPWSGPVLGSDGNFYGTTNFGGNYGSGTIFKMTIGGKLTTLYSFCPGGGNCLDGEFPVGLMQASNGNFYGATGAGGSAFIGGTLFEISAAGKFKVLHSFCSSPCTDGDSPESGPMQAMNGNLYGTTFGGGSNAVKGGTVYEITPAGRFKMLYSFCAETNCTDGQYPLGGLTQGADGNLYGTTQSGGTYGYGTVFEITTTNQLITLHSFDATDGAYPMSALLRANDGNFYGTAEGGGVGNGGTIYEVTPAGVFSTLYGFCTSTTCTGSNPECTLAQATNGDLIGTAENDGTDNYGTVFSFSTGLGPLVETVPAAAKVGKRVTILGNGLTGSTSVTFNGTSATFTVESDTYIKATVPAGATTGTVSVTTPTGTLNSNPVFQVLK